MHLPELLMLGTHAVSNARMDLLLTHLKIPRSVSVRSQRKSAMASAVTLRLVQALIQREMLRLPSGMQPATKATLLAVSTDGLEYVPLSPGNVLTPRLTLKAVSQ